MAGQKIAEAVTIGEGQLGAEVKGVKLGWGKNFFGGRCRIRGREGGGNGGVDDGGDGAK